MSFRFLHTSDWQIGKVFRFVDAPTMGLLQEARLMAITRLGELAGAHGVGHVLVAGDVYDMEALSPRSLSQPLERMRRFPEVHWHLLPGNHDPHRPNGLWDRLLGKGVPDNVHVHVDRTPVQLADDVALLPAPLEHRRSMTDPTEHMDAADTADARLRIGLAHGTVTGFGSDDRDVPNYIAPDRPERARLAYLALGDWHGQMKINARCWYSGTPETDAFDVTGGGRALLVELDSPTAAPGITPLETGHYTWRRLEERLESRADVDRLADQLRRLAPDLERVLVRLDVEGALSLEDRGYFETGIVEGAAAALCYLRVDDDKLFARPTPADLDRIDRGGFVRTAAETLKRAAEHGDAADRELAAAALERLYVEHMKLEADRR